MALVVFDMGRRVETPLRPQQKRVQATEATAGVHPISHTDASHSGEAALQAYQQQKEKHPDAVGFIREVMHREVRTLPPSATVQQAWDLVQKTGYHHLPVIDENRQVLAMFSDFDLLQALARQPASTLPLFWSSNIMTLAVKPVLCVLQDTDIRQSSRILYEYNIGALPVLNNNNELCGIVTRSDILRLLSHYGPMELWA